MRKFAPALPYILHLLPPAAAWVGGARHVLWFASSVLLTTALIAASGEPAAWPPAS